MTPDTTETIRSRVDTADLMSILDFSMQDGAMLSHNGVNHPPDGDHVPVARYVSADETIELWLTAKFTTGNPMDGATYYGLLDLGNGSPEIGPVPLDELYVASLDHPGSRLARDKTYVWRENGKRVYEILQEKRESLRRLRRS